MSDELRMPAVVTDGFSGPLKALNDLLTRVGSNPAAKNVSKDWGGVSAQINKVSTDLRSQLQPALSGVGLASLGIGGAIGAAMSAVKNFAFSTRDMNLFTRQIGMSVDQLRQLKAVGERFGMDWNTAQGSLKTFSSNMDQLQRRWGEAYGRLRAMNLGDLAEDLFSSKDMNTAVEKALDGIRKIQNPVRRREVAQLLFGSDQWATIASEATPAVLAEIRKLTAAVTPEMQKASDQFVKNWADMEQAVDGFVVRTLGPQLPKITGMLGDLNKAIETFQNKGILEGLKALDQMTPEVFNPNAGIEGVGPADPTYHKRRRAEDLRRQIENADGQIGLVEGRGSDTRAMRGRRDELADQLRRLTDELKALRGTGGAAQVSPMAFDGGGGMAGLIQRATLGGGGGAGGNPFSASFWTGLYRDRVGGDPFRGAGRTWDRPGRAGSSGGGGGSAARGSDAIEGGAPAGDGRGTRGAAHRADMMGWAMDQLRREGVPEANLRAAAAHLVGQAQMESGLKPNTVHDGGTGYGIYGARDPKGWGNYRGARRSQMVKWLEANGYARNSAEGQMRYMAREAMGGGFAPTRRALMGASPETFDRDASIITRDFERPLIPNNRTYAVRQAYATEPVIPAAPSASPDRRAEGSRNVAGWGSDREMQEGTGVRRNGDSMMGRGFRSALLDTYSPKLNASGSVVIHLTGGLEKAPARVSMDGMFRDVRVNRKVSLTDTGDGSP